MTHAKMWIRSTVYNENDLFCTDISAGQKFKNVKYTITAITQKI